MTLFIISLAFGAFVAMMVWQTYNVFRRVPAENRQFLDLPPLGFRLVWPFIQALVHYFGDRFNEQLVEVTAMKLKRSGAEFSVSPKQFIAARYVSAIGFALFASLLGLMLGSAGLLFSLVAAICGFYYPDLWLKERMQKRQAEILRVLPFYLDVITLSVEAGSNLTGGMSQAVQKTPDSALRREISRVLRDIRAGKARAEALRELADRAGSPQVKMVVAGLIQAEKTGSSLGPILRAQSDQLRTQRFQRAEKLAMEAPVKMLGPLVMFIFPTTFLVLAYLILSKAMVMGVITWPPLVWAWQWPGGLQ
ncbi:MAG: secretion system protein [Gammaproteobacteria bacterium]|nr:MAG: secretion system protein [Gammaproteobacteria bacterium]